MATHFNVMYKTKRKSLQNRNQIYRILSNPVYDMANKIGQIAQNLFFYYYYFSYIYSENLAK